ncbi:PucR family transcriptional regulator [Glycomyces sp. NPDC048151]|uniref:PucR family transcriptional regulator n=1 Tax=Glycomyces sp. NPDC048151 TaxID=3364002 RepID=UPI00371A6896
MSRPIRLDDVLAAFGDQLVRTVVLPAGGPAAITGVALLEPGDTPEPGQLVLVVGARGGKALTMAEDAARAGAAALVVKGGPVPEQGEVPLAIVHIDARARWDQVEMLARTAIEGAWTDDASVTGLPALAETVATLVGGLVSIEDAAHQVVAYSHTGDDADAVRRQTIMGRRCPEPYRDHLRTWGVYRKLWPPEEAVAIPADPAIGANERLAIGIQAGNRPLGSIWVQRTDRPFSADAAEVLRGASRLAALRMAGPGGQARPAAAPQRLAAVPQDFTYGLLTGRVDSALLARHLGLDADTAMTVAAVDLHDPGTDAAAKELRRTQALDVAAVYAAAYRHDVYLTEACGLVYLMVPGPGDGVEDWLGGLVATLRASLGTPAKAAVADRVAKIAEIPAAKEQAYQILLLGLGAPVVSIGDVRSKLQLRKALDAVAAVPELRGSAVAALSPELAKSLRAYLDAFGDVAVAAAALHVHPNTLRYRLKRIRELAGIDLDDPDERLLATLQLRLADHG